MEIGLCVGAGVDDPCTNALSSYFSGDLFIGSISSACCLLLVCASIRSLSTPSPCPAFPTPAASSDARILLPVVVVFSSGLDGGITDR